MSIEPAVRAQIQTGINVGSVNVPTTLVVVSDDFTGWINGLGGVKSVSMGTMKDLIVIQKWTQDEIIKRQFAK